MTEPVIDHEAESAPDFTDAELLRIVDVLSPDFVKRVADYDERKYPKDTYANLRRAFGQPKTISGGDIRRALEWKYGHWGKASYPEHHREMAEKIWSRWGAFSKSVPPDAQGIFDFWMKELGGRKKAPYITVTFLLHLLRPKEFPIIDQHTFRAMNSLMNKVRPDWSAKNAPSTWLDLLNFAEFFRRLREVWATRGEPPSPSDLDKGLMAYGQILKPRAAAGQSVRVATPRSDSSTFAKRR